MNWETLSPILISVGVIAAAVAGIANVVVALMNNARLRAIEKEKHMSELIQYRYTKLYTLLEDLEREHGFVTYIDDPSKTLTETTVKRLRFLELYKLAKPLIDGDLRKTLDFSVLAEHESWKPVLAGLMSKNIEVINDSLPSYNEAANDFLEELGNTITKQISNLLKK